MGGDAGIGPRHAGATSCRAEQSFPLGGGPRLAAGVSPCEVENPVIGGERPTFDDGIAQLPVKVHHPAQGPHLASQAIHQPKRHHALGARDRSDLEPDVLAVTLSKFSTDLNSHDFVTPPELCVLICQNQPARSLLLSEMSSFVDINLATR
jgi:hypothetical protein